MDSWGNHKSLWTTLDNSRPLSCYILCPSLSFYFDLALDLRDLIFAVDLKQIIFMTGHDESTLCRTLPINQIFRYLQNRSRVQARTNCNFEVHDVSIFFHIFPVSTLSRVIRFGSMSKRTCGLRAAFWALMSLLIQVQRCNWPRIAVSRSIMPSQTACDCMDTFCRYMNLVIDDAEDKPVFNFCESPTHC